MDNGITLCAGCHMWWHHEPIEATEWIKRKLGNKKYQKLRRKARLITGNWSEADFIAVKKTLE